MDSLLISIKLDLRLLSHCTPFSNRILRIPRKGEEGEGEGKGEGEGVDQEKSQIKSALWSRPVTKLFRGGKNVTILVHDSPPPLSPFRGYH